MLVRRVAAVSTVVDRCMGAGERGGRGSRTRLVRVEDPVLVPMSKAERSAAVAALTEIFAAWWTRQQVTDRITDRG
jgi:hypothetical protein